MVLEAERSLPQTTEQKKRKIFSVSERPPVRRSLRLNIEDDMVPFTEEDLRCLQQQYSHEEVMRILNLGREDKNAPGNPSEPLPSQQDEKIVGESPSQYKIRLRKIPRKNYSETYLKNLAGRLI